MSTAILISGQMRSFAQTYPTQRWSVYRHYSDPHFFVSCVDDEQAKSAELLRNDFENVFIERYTDPELPEIPQEQGAHSPYGNAASHKNLLLQHWGNLRVWEFMEKTVGFHWSNFDCIIRMRPDNWFHKFVPPPAPQANEAFLPWWGRFGGVNDRFAVMGPIAAYNYFQAYNRIDDLLKLGCPFHPETIVQASLATNNVILRNILTAEFSTHRLHPDPRPHRPPEIMAGDIADLILNR